MSSSSDLARTFNGQQMFGEVLQVIPFLGFGRILLEPRANWLSLALGSLPPRSSLIETG